MGLGVIIAFGRSYVPSPTLSFIFFIFFVMRHHTLLLLFAAMLAIASQAQAQNQAPNKRKVVRVVYLIPADRQAKDLYRKSIEKAAREVQQWYLAQTGMTFTLSKPVVEIKYSKQNAAWFDNTPDTIWNGEYRNLWFTGNALTETKAAYGKEYDDPTYAWVIYVDAKGQVGTGGGGRVTVPEHDILGVSGLSTDQPYIGRWYGGLAHEIGHAFGLVHATTDLHNALMMYGYTIYPKSTLTEQDLFILDHSPFMNIRKAGKKLFDAQFQHEKGWFIKRGGTWIETDKDRVPRFRFEEIEANDTFYLIEDRSRKMQLRIPRKDGWCSFWLNEKWNPLYQLKKVK